MCIEVFSNVFGGFHSVFLVLALLMPVFSVIGIFVVLDQKRLGVAIVEFGIFRALGLWLAVCVVVVVAASVLNANKSLAALVCSM